MNFREKVEKEFNEVIGRVNMREKQASRWGPSQKRNAYVQHNAFRAAQHDANHLITYVEMLRDENTSLRRELDRHSVSTPDGKELETTMLQPQVEKR